MRVKIYGAGSIGNHLAQACRRIGWSVSVVDPDSKALERMKNDIYPTRYGSWDNSIELFKLGSEPKKGFDAIFIGTPPHVRMQLARSVLAEKPAILQLEKPICTPSLDGVKEFQHDLIKSKTSVIVGYDHVLGKAVTKAEEILKRNILGDILALDVSFRETWKAIFAAHPWLSGPHDTYLGHSKRGGGASGEHSHATNLWQHFAHLFGFGRVKKVSAALQLVTTDKVDYDQSCFLNLITERGFVGRVVQDVITYPVQKLVRIQGTKGFLEIEIGGWESGDLVRFAKDGKEVEEIRITKTRPDDFFEEIKHIDDIVSGRVDYADSPVSFERGLLTMKVIAAAHQSAAQMKTIEID